MIPTCYACLVFGFLLQTPTTAASAASGNEFERLGGELVACVRDNFYDKQRGEAWAEAHACYWTKARDEEDFVRLTRAALVELNASHTAYYTADDVEYWGMLCIFSEPLKAGKVSYDSIGIDVNSDHFVRVVFAGGPAAAAGLKRGDKILLADGLPFHPIRAFRGKAAQEVVLTVQRHPDAEPIELPVKPRRIDPLQEWLEHQRHGAMRIARNGLNVYYVPMFSCAGPQFEKLLGTQLAEANDSDALIIDLRNGWGGCSLNFVSLFDRRVPEMSHIKRDGTQRDIASTWKKPLVLLVNEGSRSSKEIVAHTVQKYGIGTLVGAPTAGAVLGGRCFMLSDRSLLYLAVLDVLVDGQRMEGVGVRPDIEVPDILPFADGADPQLQRAVELLTQ